MKSLQVTPSKSILPNSSPEILRPMPGCGGVFQVVWVSEIDSHALLYQRDGNASARTLATHHNGHSCRALAERMISRESSRAVDQMEYIRQCGGMAASAETIASITQEKP